MRLTVAALEKLRLGIDAEFAEHLKTSTGSRRLTREVRAELLGLSVGTTEKILKREAVDRASLHGAFASLQIPWDESFLDVFESTAAETQASEPLATPQVRRRWPRWAFLGLVAMVLLGQWIVHQSRDPYAWHKDLNAEMALATDLYLRADYQKAREPLARAKAIVMRHREADALAWVFRLEAQLLSAEGRNHEALDRIQLAVTYLREIGAPDQYHGAREIAANYKRIAGRIDEARQDYLACLSYGKSAGDRHMVATACRGLGEVSLSEKRYEEALAWFDQGIAVLGEGYEVDTVIDLRSRRGLVLAHQGKHAEAISLLKSGLRHWEQKRHPRWIATSHYRLGQAFQMQGDRVKADTHLALAKLGFQKVGDRRGVEKAATLLADR